MTGSLSSQLFENAWGGIADELHKRASYAKDGNVYWRGPTHLVNGRARQGPLGPYLYPGTLGIAFFLAACERQRRTGIDRDLTLRALAPLRREIASLSNAPTSANANTSLLGGLSGLGSLIYGLVEIGELLGTPELKWDAHHISNLLTLDAIKRDRHLDVMFGSAGTLLALLALHRVAPTQNLSGFTPLDLAVHCARHLLNSQVPGATGGKGWPNGPNSEPIGGFAHGSAGICYALLRLFEHTGQAELKEAALAGLEHERSLFIPEQANWRIAWRPDVRFVNTWCNGAPGILLGRLGGLGCCNDSEVQMEIEHGVNLVGSLDLDENDHICCGNMGRVEVLLFAYSKTGNSDFLQAAEKLAQKILLRAEEKKGFSMSRASCGIFDPRFFLGVTGIGYSLLHLADPLGLPFLIALG